MFGRATITLGIGPHSNFALSCKNLTLRYLLLQLITSTKEVMFSSLFVCLSVSNFTQKLPNGFAWNCQGRLAMGQ